MHRGTSSTVVVVVVVIMMMISASMVVMVIAAIITTSTFHTHIIVRMMHIIQAHSSTMIEATHARTTIHC